MKTLTRREEKKSVTPVEKKSEKIEEIEESKEKEEGKMKTRTRKSNSVGEKRICMNYLRFFYK